jgi:hypothetical protein
MKNSALLIVFVLFLLIFSNITAQSQFKPRPAVLPSKSESYLFITSKTPDYIIKKAAKKKISFAFEMTDKIDEWIKPHLDGITKGNVILFVTAEPSTQQKKFIDDLAKLSDYKLKIFCVSDKCEKNNSWRHNLIKAEYSIFWTGQGKKENLILKGPEKSSSGTFVSVLGQKNFRNGPALKSSFLFKEHRLGFVLIDENSRPEFLNEADTIIYFYKSEKKLGEFIEKKF